ncbi:unnamed protein product [Closterium sp. Yama58-4]|nr:unnamed protein product [Closterium sp. Yama58-4]
MSQVTFGDIGFSNVPPVAGIASLVLQPSSHIRRRIPRSASDGATCQFPIRRLNSNSCFAESSSRASGTFQSASIRSVQGHLCSHVRSTARAIDCGASRANLRAGVRGRVRARAYVGPVTGSSDAENVEGLAQGDSEAERRAEADWSNLGEGRGDSNGPAEWGSLGRNREGAEARADGGNHGAEVDGIEAATLESTGRAHAGEAAQAQLIEQPIASSAGASAADGAAAAAAATVSAAAVPEVPAAEEAATVPSDALGLSAPETASLQAPQSPTSAWVESPQRTPHHPFAEEQAGEHKGSEPGGSEHGGSDPGVGVMGVGFVDYSDEEEGGEEAAWVLLDVHAEHEEDTVVFRFGYPNGVVLEEEEVFPIPAPVPVMQSELEALQSAAQGEEGALAQALEEQGAQEEYAARGFYAEPRAAEQEQAGQALAQEGGTVSGEEAAEAPLHEEESRRYALCFHGSNSTFSPSLSSPLNSRICSSLAVQAQRENVVPSRLQPGQEERGFALQQLQATSRLPFVPSPLLTPLPSLPSLAIQPSERKEDVVLLCTSCNQATESRTFLHSLSSPPSITPSLAIQPSERKEDVVLHQLQLKPSERKEDVVLHQLQLKVGVYSVPHPARASRGGDDAYLVEGNWLGVADGIGTWTDQGINAGLYSREMMWNCVNVIRSRQEGADSDEDGGSDGEFADHLEGGRSDSELDSDHNDSAGVGRGAAAGGSMGGSMGGRGGAGGRRGRGGMGGSLDGTGGTGGTGGGAGGRRGRGVGGAGGGVVSGAGAGGDDYDYGYYDDEEDLDPMDPKGVIEESHSRTDLRGSCTITLAVLDKDRLRVASIGSCGFVLLRRGELVIRSERMEHSFGNPFQIGHEAGDGPDCAKDYTIPVQAGDAILLATNGLFDNLFLDHIVRVLCAALGEGKKPESVARKLVSMAHKAGESTTEPTPYAIAAKAAGVHHEGGRRDDVTVIVAYVQ